MAGLGFEVNPLLFVSGQDAAGTQLAHSHVGPMQTRPETYRMFAKLAYAAVAILVVTPAAVTVMTPPRHESAAMRSVELSDPILGFTQMDNRIQLRLRTPANDTERNARHEVMVRTNDGHEMKIPLKPGQTWASFELPANLAGAAELHISID